MKTGGTEEPRIRVIIITSTLYTRDAQESPIILRTRVLRVDRQLLLFLSSARDYRSKRAFFAYNIVIVSFFTFSRERCVMCVRIERRMNGKKFQFDMIYVHLCRVSNAFPVFLFFFFFFSSTVHLPISSDKNRPICISYTNLNESRSLLLWNIWTMKSLEEQYCRNPSESARRRIQNIPCSMDLITK